MGSQFLVYFLVCEPVALTTASLPLIVRIKMDFYTLIYL